ncbi:hypothetical protein ACQP2H_24135 [Micromonospora sp. CA-248260]|uniref:hypothetical protein n=1 Tax=Micromonospora sp. CA-248260 TaxID=3239962 RepID=UPI003D8BB426
MNVSDGVAIYGALMASGVAAWQFVVYRREALPVLKVEAVPGHHMNGDTGTRSLQVSGQITNHGRSRVQLMKLTLWYDVPSSLLPPKEQRSQGTGFHQEPRLPRWLEPGEAVEYTMPNVDRSIASMRRHLPFKEDGRELVLRVTVTVATGQQVSQAVRFGRWDLDRVGLNGADDPPSPALGSATT